MVEDCVNIGGKIAFLSTPSVYFALPEEARAKSYCFDVSEIWFLFSSKNSFRILNYVNFIVSVR